MEIVFKAKLTNSLLNVESCEKIILFGPGSVMQNKNLRKLIFVKSFHKVIPELQR